VTHLVHDATSLPFPGGPADLIYARLLLSHLPEPEDLTARWLGALRPGGRLLLDEVEWIRTQDTAFQRYLALVTQMLSARGQDLYIGARIEKATRGARRSVCEVRELTLPGTAAAGMFSLNLAELRQQATVREQQGEAELDALAAALRARLEGATGGAITWGMRQMAIEV
jgi:SAM-dependent methyltransferase